MRIGDGLRAGTDAAEAGANALREHLGADTELAVQAPGATLADIVGDATPRIAARTFTAADGSDGVVALVALPELATALERGASDELIATASADALDAVAHAIAALTEIDVETQPPYELDLRGLRQEMGDDESVVYPLVAGDTVMGALVVAVAAPGPAPAVPADTQTVVHAAAAPTVLADVEMGVTAELGRCEMTVRELLALTPGAVIDLDRAAGAPVDVLVNGTLIARGEVVVIDEEFGIRIQEILAHGAHR